VVAVRVRQRQAALPPEVAAHPAAADVLIHERG
jgi:hypothetical protein